MTKTRLFKLVVAGGKGGVGKSMLASSFVMLAAENRQVVAVDCDVDAPNLAVWLGGVERWDMLIPVSVSARPKIDYNKCNGCNLCAENCRFKAITMARGKPKLNQFLCESCGVCEIVCPQKAIKLKAVQNGEIKIKRVNPSTRPEHNFSLVSGQLFPGETGSGKIVSEIKKTADEIWSQSANLDKKEPLEIIDSAPGTGCPVTASLKDANFVILVTEPTLSGFSDLKRILQVVNFFNLPFGITINKWDINRNISQKIEMEFKAKLLGKISYDKKIFRAISNLTPIVKTKLKAKTEIKSIFTSFLSLCHL